MELGAYIKPLIKWWWLLIAATIVALVSSYFITSRQPLVYQSRVTLIVGSSIFESNPTSGDIYLNQQLGNFYANLGMRSPVRKAAMQELGLDWLPEYYLRFIANSQIIEIVVTDTYPERAQAAANALADALISQTPTNAQNQMARGEFIDQQLSQLEINIRDTQDELIIKQEALGEQFSAKQISDTQGEITALQTKLNIIQANYAALLANTQQGAINTLSILETAYLPSEPVGPDKYLIILLSGVIALVISIGAVYLLEYLDDTLKSPEDIHKLLGIPVVGFISTMEKGKYHGDYVAKHPRSQIAESFRALRTDLEFSAVDKPLKTILITSSGVAAGKTSIAINLAVVIAQGGKKVYLIDADLRKPNVHRSLGLPNRQGLSDAFRRDKDIRDLTQFWQEGGIHVVTSGPLPPNPSELLGSQKMDEILQTVEREADVVIIDGPPFLVTDATILSAKAEGVILVVRYGHTRKEAATNAVKQLQRTGARTLGVVFNQIPRTTNEKYGVYRYYTGYSERDYPASASPQNGKAGLLGLFSREPKNTPEE